MVRCVFGTECSCGRVEWTEAGGNARGPLMRRLQPPRKQLWPPPRTLVEDTEREASKIKRAADGLEQPEGDG